jgi:hypothetical protein
MEGQGIHHGNDAALMALERSFMTSLSRRPTWFAERPCAALPASPMRRQEGLTQEWTSSG